MIFIVFILFLIFQRLAELYVSSKNEKWLLKNGAIEYGKEHYPFIVALHTFHYITYSRIHLAG
jgi:methyltransferase